jgi:hypothetical protein
MFQSYRIFPSRFGNCAQSLSRSRNDFSFLTTPELVSVELADWGDRRSLSFIEDPESEGRIRTVVD